MARNRSKTIFIRQWKIIELLTDKKHGLTITHIQQELGMSKSTLYRDLSIIQGAGFPIGTKTVGGESRYYFCWQGTSLPAICPTPMQLVALHLARRMVVALEGTSIIRELDQLLCQWDAMLDQSKAQAIKVDANNRSPCIADGEEVDFIFQAIGTNRRLAFDYRGAHDGNHKKRVVDPIKLKMQDEHLYLVGFDCDRQDWRLFKVSRMSNVQKLCEAAGRHDLEKVDQMFAHSVKVWTGEPVDVAIRMSAKVAPLVREWPLSRGQQEKKLNDGRVIVNAKVAGIEESARWVMGWGGEAEALEPPSLRAAVRNELERALANYANNEQFKPDTKLATPT